MSFFIRSHISIFSRLIKRLPSRRAKIFVQYLLINIYFFVLQFFFSQKQVIAALNKKKSKSHTYLIPVFSLLN